jgi:hypothetical protein
MHQSVARMRERADFTHAAKQDRRDVERLCPGRPASTGAAINVYNMYMWAWQKVQHHTCVHDACLMGAALLLAAAADAAATAPAAAVVAAAAVGEAWCTPCTGF